MANNNLQNIRFLRNGRLFNTRNDALSGLTGQTLAAEQDGSIILARYNSSEGVKTLVGVVYYADGDNKSITIFDIEGASGDVQELRTEINNKLGTGITSANTATAQLGALSGATFTAGTSSSADTSVEGAKAYAYDLVGTLEHSDTAVPGEYVSQVTQADGIIAVERVALPSANSVSGESKVIIDVTQDKGGITATAANITGVKLDGYAEGNDADIAATDTLGEALGKLQAQINAMDLTVVSGDGEVITAVSEEDGKVSASKTAIKDVKLTGYVKDTTKTGAISATDDVEDALSKLENTISSNAISNADGSITVTPANGSTTDVKVHIKSGENVIKLDGEGGGIYTNLNLVEITGETLPAEIKVRYELRDSDNVKIGESIDIPKDSHIVSITYITDSGDTHYQNLKYVYIDASGATQTTYVDMSELVLEAEFASGLTIENHVARGVVDPTSETFLTVGANGFKLAGVQDAIDTAVSGLDADVSGNSTHVTVGVKEVDGVITTVTVAESDIANKTDLDALSGKTVTAVVMTGGTAAIDNAEDGTKKITINTDGSQIKMTNYSKGSDSGAVTAADTVNVAIGKLENQIASKVDALDATVSGETTDGKVKVQVVQENGVLTSVTVSGTDIASDSALTAEIAARKAVDGQNGQTYAANTNANYISAATNLNDADVKLDTALKALSDATVNEVQVNGKTLAETNNAVNIQISATKGSGADANSPIVINTSDTGAVTIQLEGLDCGTY